MQKMSLEWLYRLLQDPVRLAKRYFTTNLKFLWLVGRENRRK
jgi:N-acetylglucosaminyldiphosphoundecaprenol N-acetyl-beta-D-mannosaminyltransferase